MLLLHSATVWAACEGRSLYLIMSAALITAGARVTVCWIWHGLLKLYLLDESLMSTSTGSPGGSIAENKWPKTDQFPQFSAGISASSTISPARKRNYPLESADLLKPALD